MSKPRELWWPYALNVIRKYPEYAGKMKVIKSPQITARYNASGGGSREPGRTTEQVALRELPRAEREYYSIVEKALDDLERNQDGTPKPNGALQRRMVELYYFGQRTLAGAALECHISYSTAKNWNQQFVRSVGERLVKRKVWPT